MTRCPRRVANRGGGLPTIWEVGMTMMAYVKDDAVEVYYVASGVSPTTDVYPHPHWYIDDRNLPTDAGQMVWEQMLREMRLARVGEWGTATDGRRTWWAAEVAWMAGVAGE